MVTGKVARIVKYIDEQNLNADELERLMSEIESLLDAELNSKKE